MSAAMQTTRSQRQPAPACTAHHLHLDQHLALHGKRLALHGKRLAFKLVHCRRCAAGNDTSAQISSQIYHIHVLYYYIMQRAAFEQHK